MTGRPVPTPHPEAPAPAVPAVDPGAVRTALVFGESGRFAGWPANYGMWNWGEEVVVVFTVGWIGPLVGVHARDMTRPFLPLQARSSDGGLSWTPEPFTGALPGGLGLSSDEHVDPGLRVAPAVSAEDFRAAPDDIDFTDPETVLMFGRTELGAGSRSWFYRSTDRARRWEGPYELPGLGQPGLSARTDVIALDRATALVLLTAAKADGHEGHVFAATMSGGGAAVAFTSWLGPEPSGYQIMPSSVRTADAVLTAVRCAAADFSRHWIDLYRSHDAGLTWDRIAQPVASTGYAGNPPALTALPDGRLVLVFGHRDPPYGLQATVGTADGTSWSDPVVLSADAGSHDLGYPRAVTLPDGSVLACWYRTDIGHEERYIASLRWNPPPG